MRFFLAFVVKSNDSKTLGGEAVPDNLYIKAVPSGIGKNKEAVWAYYLIFGS